MSKISCGWSLDCPQSANIKATIIASPSLCNRPISSRLLFALRAQQTDPNIGYFIIVDNEDGVMFTGVERRANTTCVHREDAFNGFTVGMFAFHYSISSRRQSRRND